MTDILMPGADGLAVVSVCKNLYPDIGIIMISGMPNGKALPVDLSGAVFLSKPFAPSSLVSAVERSLQKSMKAGD